MDHSNIDAKIAVRLWAIEALPDPLRVLDAYAGHGDVWAAVRATEPGRDIRVTAVEIDPDRAQPGAIVADNLTILGGDLSAFDLVDLDAHGWPVRQLDAISRRPVRPQVVLTRPQPGPRRRAPNVVRAAGGWNRFCGRLGWRLVDWSTDHTGEMSYEHLAPR